jgi:hypothetical protein
MAGEQCRLRNPWGESAVTLYRDGKRAEEVKGSLLTFATRKGETVLALRSGSSPEKFRRTV